VWDLRWQHSGVIIRMMPPSVPRTVYATV